MEILEPSRTLSLVNLSTEASCIVTGKSGWRMELLKRDGLLVLGELMIKIALLTIRQTSKLLLFAVAYYRCIKP